MKNKSKLYYDGNCPICINFANILKKKINQNEIDFIATTEHLKDFKFVDENNNVFFGNEAIDVLAKKFPIITNYFWMLPESLRIQGLKTTYKIGSTIRNVLKKTSGCGCGK